MKMTVNWRFCLILLLGICPTLVRAQTAPAKGDKDGIVLLSGGQDVSSLAELVQLLPGERKVYVDVWATWCGPCLQEFAHNAELQELLAEYDTAILYISVDEPQSTRRWRQVIDSSDLKGYHIMVNPALERELRELFGEGGGVAIPWYMLFDEEGTLVEKHARRPSEVKALRRQLRRL